MTTVLCHGVFDVVHPGHLEHFRQARQHGDKLVVAIVGDGHVRKGPGRPMFDQWQRSAFLQELRIIDEVVVVDSPLAMPILESLKPDVFCKGPDYNDPEHQFSEAFQREKAFVESYGGTVILTTGFRASSTAIIGEAFNLDNVLEDIRKRYSLDNVIAWMKKARQAKTEVIGETILDEYIYVQPLSKSAKDNIIAFQPVGRECWHGGASIVEADLRQFVNSVHRIRNGTPIRKTRYVDEAFSQKLFSLVEMGSHESIDMTDKLGDNDLIVVADYGHGAISKQTIEILTQNQQPHFLALTVQSNSANWGFNLLTKWPRADYVVVDRNELQLAAADKENPIEQLVSRMANKMGTKYFAVTLGHEGCLVNAGGVSITMPALADKIIDRMGAGDAFLAATAPLAWAGAPLEVIALIGNIAGAIKVGKLGNQPVMKAEVDAWLQKLIG